MKSFISVISCSYLSCPAFLMFFLRSFLLMGTWLIFHFFEYSQLTFFLSNRWMISWLGLGFQVQSLFNSIEQNWFLYYRLSANIVYEDPYNKEFELCRPASTFTIYLCSGCTNAVTGNMEMNKFATLPLWTPCVSELTSKEENYFTGWVSDPNYQGKFVSYYDMAVRKSMSGMQQIP